MESAVGRNAPGARSAARETLKRLSGRKDLCPCSSRGAFRSSRRIRRASGPGYLVSRHDAFYPQPADPLSVHCDYPPKNCGFILPAGFFGHRSGAASNERDCARLRSEHRGPSADQFLSPPPRRLRRGPPAPRGARRAVARCCRAWSESASCQERGAARTGSLRPGQSRRRS